MEIIWIISFIDIRDNNFIISFWKTENYLEVMSRSRVDVLSELCSPFLKGVNSAFEQWSSFQQMRECPAPHINPGPIHYYNYIIL